ncbi:hypothetical protein [Neisseria sp. oral taxon 014]|uniref:hypothetical protein n=1 Tax=Neisseria sp. oral taxon 014 TaxID=641148 RepID=UPI0025F2496F|nr:hypothetical protein [Neisseria sp. oral taxon 014]
MLYKKLLLVSTVMLFVFSAGCEADSHEKHSEIQQSTLKGKRNMSNLNLMLNEVFKTRITDISSQRADVSHIVSQYIHSGTPRHEINNFISNDFDILENSNNKLLIHYKKGEGNLGNRRDLYISLFFDGNGNLLNNSSYLDKSNNL